MRLLILSNSSFAQPAIRTGLQQLALEWAQLGCVVDYVSCPLHPLDCLSPSRRGRWWKAWCRKSSVAVPVDGEGELVEHFVKAPFSRRKVWWQIAKQLQLYSCWFPRYLSKECYDVCLFDSSHAALFRNQVQARKFIYRINDNPEGFEQYMGESVIEWFRSQIREAQVDAVWPVSGALATWALALNHEAPVTVLPNGVALSLYTNVFDGGVERCPRAVYVGAFNAWFDWGLLRSVGQNLPDEWSVDLYGPLNDRSLLAQLPANIRWCGEVAFEDVPSVLSSYAVGLLPFCENGSLLDYFDPLKACQYWAAGLGVVATDYGRMGDALLPWAVLDNSASGFAAAIGTAAEMRTTWLNDPKLCERLQSRDWSSLAVRTLKWMTDLQLEVAE